jgi:hypothetical protein
MTTYYELEYLARTIVAERRREAKMAQRWNEARKAIRERTRKPK